MTSFSELRSDSSKLGQQSPRKHQSGDSNKLAEKSILSVGSLGKTSSDRSQGSAKAPNSPKTSDPQERKAKLKRFLRKESTRSLTSQGSGTYKQLLDFSSYHLVAPSRESAHYTMYNRTSMHSAGVIEISASFEDRERKRDRQELEESRKKNKKSSCKAYLQPMQINLKPYQLEELKEAFSLLENEMELIDIIHVPTIIRACGFEPNNEEVREILEEIKPVNEGYLNLHELIQVFEAKLKRKDPIDEIRRAFKVFDVDNSGLITLDNLKEISKCVGEELHEEELKEMISAADRNNSGGVTMDGFVKLITRKEYFD